MISSLGSVRFASHLGGLGATPTETFQPQTEIPAPVEKAFPLLAVGAVALITYFIIAAIKDGNKPPGE